jgi:succinate dehydrogenase/fumarate reductase iron-sulfur protein
MDQSKIRIFRYDPARDEKPRYDQYEIPYNPDQTILDSLKYIQKDHDRSLSFRGECGYQMCGTCGVRMNGRPALACNTGMEREMVIDPLLDIPVIKDLVIDRSWIYARIHPARPYLARKNPVGPQLEPISWDTYDLHNTAASCIECYVCTAGCPLFDQRTDPASALKISRVALDLRDGMNRMEAISEAVSKCLVCKTCSGLCPLNVRVDRIVLRDRERLMEEKGLPFFKKMAIGLLNYPTLLWIMVRIGYPFRGIMFARDRGEFPALAGRPFRLENREE